jgi:choline dehydrogenase-like flavoprotein
LLDAIIVGSGPAGTSAAYALGGKKVLVLDVGYKPIRSPELEENIYRLRQNQPDLFESLIGERFEGLHNISRRTINLKLKSPFMSCVAKNQEELSPVSSLSFNPLMSFAQGGLANAWGAGVYRFNERDLDGFPISTEDLEPFYEELTAHIGICGKTDDLEPYFGNGNGLLPPMRLSKFAADLLERYAANASYFHRRNIYVGYPRLAVLTENHRNRRSYRYHAMEFYNPLDPAVYNPAYTLNELIQGQLIQYKTPYLAIRFKERDEHVEVVARDLDRCVEERFSARTLLIAAGTLNTTKLVLQSNDDAQSKLPILDNQISCVPLFRWDRIGAPLEIDQSSLGQLNIIYEGPPRYETLQATLFGSIGPLRSDILFDLPFSLSANLALTKYIAPAMGVLMVFYPGRLAQSNYIKLNQKRELEVSYHGESLGHVEKRMLKAFRKIGYFGAASLCKYPPMGSGVHYAGTLPMKDRPEKYQTDKDGRLFDTRRVYIADGACFPALPAKNLTFTIMANAMRIAKRIRGTLD